MLPNMDYLTREEVERIYEISKKENMFLYQIGRECGIRDKAFWCRIMQGKKPIPEHARISLMQFFREKGV